MSGMGYAQIGSSIAGGFSKGFGQRAASKTRVMMYRYNENALNDQANLVKRVGRYRVKRFESRAKKFLSSQKAKIGVSGLTPGSFKESYLKNVREIAMDKEYMKWQTEVEKRKIKNQRNIQHWLARRDERQSKLSAWGNLFSMGG